MDQAPRFGPRQLAGTDALADSLALVLLPRVEPRRIRHGGHGNNRQQGGESEFLNILSLLVQSLTICGVQGITNGRP